MHNLLQNHFQFPMPSETYIEPKFGHVIPLIEPSTKFCDFGAPQLTVTGLVSTGA